VTSLFPVIENELKTKDVAAIESVPVERQLAIVQVHRKDHFMAMNIAIKISPNECLSMSFLPA